MEPPKGSPSSEHSAGRRHLFHRKQHLDFPFRENTIARRAQAPGVGEINYQLSPNVDPSLLVDLPTEDRVESELESDASAAAVELSSAEIKRRRRNARLAARLKEVFGLEEEEEVLEEMTCWLLRSVSEYSRRSTDNKGRSANTLQCSRATCSSPGSGSASLRTCPTTRTR
jgi:sterol 3beta-glucosyltransferase